jgi:hypothetical protein
MESRRRAFLKVSAAAPVVLTVGPGSAIAASSSVACLARDAKRDPTVVAPSTDEWLRTQVNVVQLSQWNGQSCNVIPGQYFLGPDRVTYWSIDGNQSVMPTSYSVTDCVAQPVGTRYALVHIDQRGQPTGMAWEPKGGSPVTSSCWTSVRAAA